jgi:enoyl-CoA hydratase
MSDGQVPEGKVHCEISGPVAQITFDNPTARNALTHAMWCAMRDYCYALARDRRVRVVTFRGVGGKAFVSGSDISEFHKMKTGQDGVTYERGIDEYIGAVEALPMTTIAIVDGWAVGGGLNIVCGCDFRIATPDAKFGSPLGRTIGNCLSMNSYLRIAAAIGTVTAKRMLLLGEFITAQELLQGGALYSVVERAELDAAVAALCEKAVANAPLTTKVSKEAMRRKLYSSPPDIDDLISQVYTSTDFRNGVKAFLAKTKVEWTGE